MVKSELDKLGIEFNQIELAEVKLAKPISKALQNRLKETLHRSGLELMDDKKALLIEKIVNIIIETVHYADELPHINFSDFLSEKLQHNYHYLAELFSKTKGINRAFYHTSQSRKNQGTDYI